MNVPENSRKSKMTYQQWYVANQGYLMACIQAVSEHMDLYLSIPDDVLREKLVLPKKEKFGLRDDHPPRLESMRIQFNLTSFELKILLLAAATVLQAGFSEKCAKAANNALMTFPTFNLALILFSEGYWSALAPNSPLRYWGLIEVDDTKLVTESPLKINESILHYLIGLPYWDERLLPFMHTLPKHTELAPSHERLAENIASLWMLEPDISDKSLDALKIPVIHLQGNNLSEKQAIASYIGQAVSAEVVQISAQSLPSDQVQLAQMLQWLARDAVLNNRILLLTCDGLDTHENSTAFWAANEVIRTYQDVLIVSSAQPWMFPQPNMSSFTVERSLPAEQKHVWKTLFSNFEGTLKEFGLEIDSLAPFLDRLVFQCNFSVDTIKHCVSDTVLKLRILDHQASKPSSKKAKITTDQVLDILWEVCLHYSRNHLETSALQRMTVQADWDALVLPEPQKETLKEIVAHNRQQSIVYDTWGFSDKSTRGLGLSVLFHGASGTGKTMAAEVLAKTLNLDLYRVDLSAVVSKYVGDTEKNLQKIFDAAEAGGSILLFDEADALFGKRSEVKDSRDRHANVEVSYLLQKMEEFRGISILTSNNPEALDSAFMRRLRFVVQFPFPDAEQRKQIWKRVFPGKMPMMPLNMDALASLDIAGGNIRNIALNAAFLAADGDGVLTMKEVLQAVRQEYRKLGKSLNQHDVKQWEGQDEKANYSLQY